MGFLRHLSLSTLTHHLKELNMVYFHYMIITNAAL